MENNNSNPPPVIAPQQLEAMRVIMSMMQQLGGGATLGQGEEGMMTIPIGTTRNTNITPSSTEQAGTTPSSPSHHSPNSKRRDMKSTPGRKNKSSHPAEATTTTAASTNHTMSTTSVTSTTSTSNNNGAPSCDDPKKSKSLLRSFEEIQKVYVQERKWFHEGMPLNPYPTLEALVDALNEWAQSRTTCGGGFAIIKDTSNDSSGKRGKTRKLLCDRAGFPRPPKPDTTVDTNKKKRNRKQSKKIGCPWSIYVEEIDSGWVVTYPTEQAIKAATADQKSNGRLFHNHELIQSQTESLLNPNMRSIPPDMHDTAVLLQKAHLSPSKIFDFLMQSCLEKGIDVTFNESDIRNKYASSTQHNILDCTNLVEHLKDRERLDPLLDYKIHHCGFDGSPKRIFFVIKGGKDVWSQSNGAVLLYDTKHGTNRYGLKLGCFCSIDKHGLTRVMAGSFLLNEDEDSFAWAYSAFSQSFQSTPKILFTDSDQAMASARCKVWPDTTHLLCVFHIWKNFYQHIHPLFMYRKEEWTKVSHMWWKLCKDTDASDRDSFNDNFQTLTEFIVNNASAGKEVVEKQIPWLQFLMAKKDQWAACFTWMHRTYGIHSTQRAESVHSVIARFCCKTRTFLEITKDLEQMAEKHSLKSQMREMETMLERTIECTALFTLPMAKRIGAQLTPFARKLLNAQAAQITMYKCTKVHSGSATLPEHEQQFKVTMFVPNDDKEELPSMYSSDEFINPPTELSRAPALRHALIANDHGISTHDGGKQPRVHVASLQGCSCQYHQCWGLPCRHIIRIMMDAGESSWKTVMVCCNNVAF